jgi:HlyD family secretion protein
LWLLSALVVVALIAFLPQIRKGLASQEEAPAAAPAAKPSANVACVGHIEPTDGVTRVSAPYLNGHPAIVGELRVAVGDRVHTGQTIAILDGRQQLEAAVRQAEARLALGQMRIEQAKAAPKASEVAAQQAEVDRLQASYVHAAAEFHRYEALHQKRDVSTSDMEAKRAEMENDAHLRDEAAARLKSLTEIRPEDVRTLESELAVSRTELDRARLELESTVVHSPANGKVLHIRAWPGEEAGQAGIVELVRTDSMCVIAEVYETDLARVHVGQKATVSGDLLSGQMEGTVSAIGSEIGRAELFPGDPAAFADSRVVNVKIQIANNAALAGLIHGKVRVVMEP